MRSFGGGGKDPLSCTDGCTIKRAGWLCHGVLSGGLMVAVETDV